MPAPEATAFDLRFTDAAALVEAWQAWAPDAPDELAASLVITAGPDPDEPPDVKVFGAMLGSRAETEALLSRFDPESAELFHGSHRDVKRHLAGTGGPDEGIPYNRSEFFRELLPREAIDELIGHFEAGRRPGETRELDFSPWGGAYNRVAVDATAFAHRDARFLLKHAAVLEPGMAPDALARPLVGDRAPVGHRRRLRELPGARAPGQRLLGRQHRAPQCGCSPVAAGGRDSSASEVMVSMPRAASSSTPVASSFERA